MNDRGLITMTIRQLNQLKVQQALAASHRHRGNAAGPEIAADAPPPAAVSI